MIRTGNWQAFLPACILFAIEYVPLIAIGLWGKIVGPSDQIAGAGLAWGLMVTIPRPSVGVWPCWADWFGFSRYPRTIQSSPLPKTSAGWIARRPKSVVSVDGWRAQLFEACVFFVQQSEDFLGQFHELLWVLFFSG